MQSGCNVVGRVVWFVVQIGLCSVGGQQPIPRDVQTSVTGVWSSRELTSLPGNGCQTRLLPEVTGQSGNVSNDLASAKAIGT